MKRKTDEKPFFVDDEVKELKAEIARLRGVIRAMKRIAKTNLKFHFLKAFEYWRIFAHSSSRPVRATSCWLQSVRPY
jgi:hypothetical protein